MVRLILGLMLFTAVVLAIASVAALIRGFAGPPVAVTPLATKEDPMPDAIRNIAFVLLLVLMLGVSTGWLGAV
jgi:hypothetical protein